MLVIDLETRKEGVPLFLSRACIKRDFVSPTDIDLQWLSVTMALFAETSLYWRVLMTVEY